MNKKIDTEQIRALAEKAINYANDKNIEKMLNKAHTESRAYQWIMRDMSSCINQILLLLPEPCPTCGGSGVKPRKHYDMSDPDDIPCPDCQSKPSTGAKVFYDSHLPESEEPAKQTQNPNPEPDHPYPDDWYSPDEGYINCLKINQLKGKNCRKCVMRKICEDRSQEPEKPDHIVEVNKKVEPTKPVSEFMEKIEALVERLSEKPTPAETKRFFIALIDILFDTKEKLEAAKIKIGFQNALIDGQQEETKQIYEQLDKYKDAEENRYLLAYYEEQNIRLIIQEKGFIEQLQQLQAKLKGETKRADEAEEESNHLKRVLTD